MRPAALFTSICALSTSVMAVDLASSFNTGDLASLTASAAQIYSHLATENLTQLYSQANSLATGELATLSQLAATETGALGSSFRAEYTSLKSQLAGAQATASTALGLTTTGSGSSPSASASASASQTGAPGTPATGLAPDTVVPIAAVGVGMVLLGLL